MTERLGDLDSWFDEQDNESQGLGSTPVVDPLADFRDPDEIAQERRIAEEVGEPDAAIRAYPELFARRAEANQRQRATEGTPRLRAWLADPNNAAVARDDVENLSTFERWWRRGVRFAMGRAERYQDQGPAGDFGAALSVSRDPIGAFAYGGARAISGAATTDPLGNEQGRQGELDVEYGNLAYRAQQEARGNDALTPEERARLDELATREGQGDWGPFIIGPTRRLIPQVLGAFGRAGEQAAARADEAWSDPFTLREGERWTARRVLEGGVAAAVEAPAVAVATFGGAGGGYLSFGYEMETGIAFDAMIRDGIAPDIAAERAEQYGAWATAIEFASDTLLLPISGTTRLATRTLLGERVLAQRPGMRAAGAVLGSGVEQGAEEAAQEYAQIIHQDLARQDQAGGEARVRWSEVLTPEHIEQILMAGYIGFQGGVGMGSFPAAANFALDMRSIRQAEAGATQFEAWTRAAQSSRLSERGLASTLESAVGAMDDSNVYIDADRFIEHFQSAGANAYAVAEELGLGERALSDALASHGVVEIPTSRFVARVLRIPEHAVLAEHARVAPDAATPAEAKSAEAVIRAQAERIVEETQTIEADADLGRAIETRLRELFDAAEQEGGYRPEVARRYAQLAAALPRAMVARARAVDPAYADRLEGQFRTLFGERFDIAGPGRDGGFEGAAELPQGTPEQAQRHFDYLNEILEERRSLSNPSVRRAPPEQIPEVGTREYAEAAIEAREAQARGERLTANQRAIIQWEADNVFPDGLFQEALAPPVAPWIAARFSQEEIASWLALIDDPNATPEQILAHPIQTALEAEAPPPVFTKETVSLDGALAGRRYQIDGQEFDAPGYIAHMRVKFEAEVGAPLRQERIAVLVTGQPGAGKSTTRQGLARIFGAVSVDLDEMRTGIPEFAEGKGSSRTTQAEANALRLLLLDQLTAEGQNVLYEMVGKSEADVLNEAARLKADGYTVSLANVNVDYANSVRRYARRTISGGRWVHADFIASVADAPARVFDTLVAEGSLSGYIQVDGNGPQGSEKVTTAQGAIDKEALETALRSLSERPGRDDGRTEEARADDGSADGQGDAQGVREAAQRGARGSIRYENFRSGEFGSAMIRMGKASDLSTFLHEFGHLGHLVLESIAADPQAPAEFRAMWDNTLQWWNVTQEQWDAFTPAQKTQKYEMWARTFEAYLMEGKAPSLSLREAFAAFKAWLTQIYRTVFRLDANLNPQIRDVFDRMLATDQEMAEARAAMGSDFTLAREAFKTDEEFQQYTQAISDARDGQEAELRARVMDKFVRKEKRWWRSERERVRTTAEIEVDTDPARRALEWLAFNEWRPLPVEQNEDGVELPQDASLAMPEGLPEMRLDMSTLDEADRAGLPAELRPLATEADADAALENAMALKRQGRARQSQRLWAFIKAQGGIKDEGGEITQALGSARLRPGLINNTSGLDADTLALRAWEAGYFGAVPRQGENFQSQLPDAGQSGVGNVSYDVRSPEATALRRELKEHGFDVPRGLVDLPRSRVPLSDVIIHPRRAGVDPYILDEYRSLTTEPPPILVRRNGSRWHIIDGNHRATLARERGARDIEILDASGLYRNAPDGGASGAGNLTDAPNAGNDGGSFEMFQSGREDIPHRFIEHDGVDLYEPTPDMLVKINETGMVIAEYRERTKSGGGSAAEARAFFRGVYDSIVQDAATNFRLSYTWMPADERLADFYRAALARHAPPGYIFREADGAMKLERATSGFELFQSEPIRRRVIDTDRGQVIVNPNRSDMQRMTRVPLGQRDKAWMYDSVRYIIDQDGNVFVGPGANMIHDEIAAAAEGAGFKVQGYQYGDSYGHGAGVETGSFRRVGEAFTFDDIRNPSRMGNPVELFQEGDETGGRRPTPRELLDALIDDIKNVRQVYSSKDEAAVAAYQNRADAIRWFEARGIDLSGTKEEIRAQIVDALERERYPAEPSTKIRQLDEIAARRLIDDTYKNRGAFSQAEARDLAEEFIEDKRVEGETWTPERQEWFEHFIDVEYTRMVLDDTEADAFHEEWMRAREVRLEDKAGWHPDDIAPWFGFSSGDELIQALKGLKPRAVAIEDNIEARLEAQYGDPLKDGTVAEAAALAGHIEAQAKRIEIELAAIQRATGGKATPVGRAARAFAERQVQAMTVKQIRGFESFLAGERRAARNAMEATQKKKFDEAALWKQRQLISFHLYRFARDAAEEMDRAQRYFQRFDRDTIRAKIHAPLLDQIDQALEGIDLRVRPRISDRKRQSFMTWFSEMQAEGLEHMVVADPEFLEEVKNRPFTALTLEEARAMRDAVRNFEHIGRRWREVLAARDARLLDEAVADMTASMAEVKPIAFSRPDDHSPGVIERIDTGRQDFHAQLSRVEFVARAMDGMKDNGPVWNGLFRPLTEARDREEMRQEAAQRAIEQLFSVYDARERADMWTKRRFYPLVPNRDGSRMGRNFTKQEILAIALNTGNDYNFGALVAGDNWSEGQVRALLDAAMDQRDWQFVQSLWDYVDSFWPEIEQLYIKSAGVAPGKVEATPFRNRFGEWRGGYWHLEYDYGRDQRVREEAEHGAVQEAFGGFRLRTQTPNGFSKARQGSGGRPVRLDLSILTQHVNEVIHDLEFRIPVLNAWRLIKHGGFREAFVRAAGQSQYDQLKPWLQYVATERMPPERGFAGVIKLLRRNTPIALMGYALSTVAQQPAGLMGTFHRVGVGRVMGKAIELMAQPWTWTEHARFINTRSTLMRNRTRISQREIREMVQEINAQGHVDAVNLLLTGSVSQKKAALDRVTQLMQRYALFPLAFLDKWVSSAAWKAAYDKALGGHVAGVDPQNEADVIAYADQIIRTTFGSGRPEDLSPIMRSTEIGKLLTPAFSYFNTQYNQLYNEQTPGMMRGKISPLEFATFITFTLVLQALVSEFMAGRWEPDDDESEEDRNVRIAVAVAQTPVAGVPLVRDMTRSALQAGTTGHTFGSTVPAFGAVSSTGMGIGRAAYDLSEDGEISRAAARDLTMAAGYWFGLPSRQIWTTGSYLSDVAEGEELLPWNSDDPLDATSEALLRDTR